jgi:diguanylate cyclase (GGDEF)-like protein/PAS domain S-box-containing protein
VRVRLTLPIKTALLTTCLVLMLVALVGAWQYRTLSGQYVGLLQKEQQDFVRLAAADLDYKIAMHMNVLTREARTADAETFSSPAAQSHFFRRSGLRLMFDGVALIGPQGDSIANDPPIAKAYSIADRAYFRQARESGRAAISEPLHARTTGQPAIIMVVPVKDAQGHAMGMIGAGLELNHPNVLGDLAQARASNGGYYVIESGGPRPLYVVHPDPRRILTPATEGGDDAAGDLAASAHIKSTGWVLRVVLPKQAAYAPLAAAQHALLHQMLVLAVVCGVLVWAGTIWLMRPISTLYEAIRTLRQSPDSAVELDVSANDERGDLAREFDALMTELRDKRTEMATVTDASPLGLFRCDADGMMVYVNDAYLAIHGIEREEAAQGWLSLVREDARDRVWADWLRLVKSDQPFQSRRRLRRRDGAEMLLSLHMRALSTGGRVTGQVGTVHDITQRTQAEQAMRMLTAIFESTTDYVAQLDKNGHLTYMNPAARRAAGVPADAPLQNLTMVDFHPPATVERLQKEIVPTAVTQGVWVGESKVWNDRREEFPVSHMVIAHRDKDGKIERFSAIMRDISAAKATESALSESEARLRTMADALPMRVAYIDASERYQFVNQAYDGTFGTARDSIAGRTMKEFLGENHYRTVEPHIRGVLAGEQIVFDHEICIGSESEFYEVNYIPQRSVEGLSVIGFHAVVVDVTHQRRRERRLAQLASQDPLTGLGNRSAFEKLLPEAMARCREEGTRIALLYLDLDRFKQVNDRWGHPCGDALLRAVAARLSNATRAADFVSRLGGDEFTVILQAPRSVDDVGRVAQKILGSMSQPFALDALEGRTLSVSVSASAGIACYEGGAQTSEQLIRAADEMLYQAKGAGRNNWQMAPLAESAAS